MKGQIKKLMQNPMLIVLIIILIFFTPSAIYSPGQNRERGVVIAIGVDRQNEEFEISLLTFIPTVQQSYKEMSSVISGKGETMAKALYNAQIAMGRKIGLSHAKTTIVNQELLQDDVAEYIDYLSRVASLPENTVFVCTDKTAKEILQASFTLESTVGLQLEQVIGFNAENLYVTDTSLEAFYKGYYGRQKASLIGYLSIAENQSEEMTTTGTSQQSGSFQVDNGGDRESGGSSQTKTSSKSGEDSKGQKHILNKGEAVLLKEGRLAEKLTVDQLNGINLLNTKAINQIVTIDGIDLNGYKNKLSYRIKNKKINPRTYFENGSPVYSAQLILGLELVEIEGEHEHIKINTEFSKINPQIRKKLDAILKNQFTEAIKVLRENKSDVIGVSDKFYKEHRNEYNKFIKEIGREDDFIDFVNFKINLILQAD